MYYKVLTNFFCLIFFKWSRRFSVFFFFPSSPGAWRATTREAGQAAAPMKWTATVPKCSSGTILLEQFRDNSPMAERERERERERESVVSEKRERESGASGGKAGVRGGGGRFGRLTVVACPSVRLRFPGVRGVGEEAVRGVGEAVGGIERSLACFVRGRVEEVCRRVLFGVDNSSTAVASRPLQKMQWVLCSQHAPCEGKREGNVSDS